MAAVLAAEARLVAICPLDVFTDIALLRGITRVLMYYSLPQCFCLIGQELLLLIECPTREPFIYFLAPFLSTNTGQVFNHKDRYIWLVG